MVWGGPQKYFGGSKMVEVSFWGAQSGVTRMLLGRKSQKCQAALEPPKI